MARDPYGKINFQPGFRVVSGQSLNLALSEVLQGGLSREDGITATPGGTKAAARQLVATLNRVSVCATLNDSVLLPKAIAGSVVILINSGAQTLNFYGKGTDTIDGAATATAATLATTKAKTLTCLTSGAWFTTSST